jgi:uncharacterized caspase-like protein
VTGLLLAAALLAASAPARATDGDTALFTLAIGYNGLPAGTDPASPLRPLRFADDDAAAFHRFAGALSRRGYLLTVLDADSQDRFPGLAAQARLPTRRELARVVQELARELAAAEAAGDQTALLVFYSGHGTHDGSGQGSLALQDGALTQDLLYQEVLAELPARYVHLLVDACHAETVVRPRDLQAQIVSVEPVHAQDYLARATLARFPHVGAVIASTVSAQSHEWDVYRQGVFTHEVLSGLRGAADVDGDRRIEYSELAAFLSAANQAVRDPRARLLSVVQAPALNRRAAIVDLVGARGVGRLQGVPHAVGGFFVESAAGERLADVTGEPGFPVELVLPAGQDLFVRAGAREAELRLPTQGVVRLESLPLRPATARPRDAIDWSLRRGLFATGFGPTYYMGFVGGDPALGRVEVDPARLALTAEAASLTDAASAPRSPVLPYLAPGAALAAGAAIFGALALDARNDFDRTGIEREAVLARDRYDRHRKVGLGLAAASAVAGAVGLWLWQRVR